MHPHLQQRTGDLNSGVWPVFFKGQPDDPVRVLVIDDDAHVRRVIVQELMEDKRTLVVDQATNMREAKRSIRQTSFDVMLVDLNLGDGDGMELLSEVKALRPQSESIVVSVMETEEQVLRAFELGATGYLVKNNWFGSYPQAVLQVFNGGASITPNLARRLLQRFGNINAVSSKQYSPLNSCKEPLTERECVVLKMAANGNTNAEISVELDIAVMTVNAHIKNIYRKLQVRSRAHAVHMAFMNGWL